MTVDTMNFACASDIVPCGEVFSAVVSDVIASFSPVIDLTSPEGQGVWSRTSRVLESREELIMLAPDPDCKESVHSFKNPVYAPLVEAIMEDYMKRNGEYNG